MNRLFIILLAWIITGCISHKLEELEYKYEVIDMRLDFYEWNNEAEHCYLDSKLTSLEVEQCEIAAYKRWQKIRKYKETNER